MQGRLFNMLGHGEGYTLESVYVCVGVFLWLVACVFLQMGFFFFSFVTFFLESRFHLLVKDYKWCTAEDSGGVVSHVLSESVIHI